MPEIDTERGIIGKVAFGGATSVLRGEGYDATAERLDWMAIAIAEWWAKKQSEPATAADRTLAKTVGLIR